MVSSSLLKKKKSRKSDKGLGLTFADQTKVVEGVFFGKKIDLKKKIITLLSVLKKSLQTPS